MYTNEGNMPTNVILAGLASLPSWFATVNDLSFINVLGSFTLSIVLMFLGKLMDLGIKILMEKRGANKISISPPDDDPSK